MSATMEPFRIDIPDTVLADLRDRLSRARIGPGLPGSGWTQGTEREYLRELCSYWRERFDWRAAEARLNAHPQFRSPPIDGVRVHFQHVRSREPKALPLLMIHGWPGSFMEFHKLIEPLTDPVAHGGRAEDAFDVICPSLPGFGFSDAPQASGWHPRRVAAAFVELMGQLGYTRYGVQGGDWGGIIAPHVADLDPTHVVGIHLNSVAVLPPADHPMQGVLPEEIAQVQAFQAFMAEGSGYQAIQGTKPHSVGVGLDDSPAGLAAWIVEKFHDWSDCNGDLESVFSKDELLTNIMIYWVTQTATSAGRIYLEGRKFGNFGVLDRKLDTPAGCAMFPKELLLPPRAWVDARLNVARWTVMPRGGHFAALEQPQLLVEDIRALFAELR